MSKVFISVGMTGRKVDDIRNDIERAEKRIAEYCTDDKSLEVIDNFICYKPEGESRLWYLGRAIQKLGFCDYCYFCKGWEDYRGCKIEMEVCKEYGIKIIEE